MSIKKINEIDTVPSSVIQELKRTKLESGFYYFMGSFTKSRYDYIAFCRNENSNQYDVTIEKVDYEEDHNKSGVLNLTISELENKSNTDYYNEFNKPIIFYRIRRQLYLPGDLRIKSGDKNLRMNNWWGSEGLSGKSDGIKYEVIQERDKIPDNIFNKINDITLKAGVYEFDRDTFKTKDLYYLICGGVDYADDYNITFEEVKKSGISKLEDYTVHFLEFSLHEHASKGSMDYSSGFKYPFVIIKFSYGVSGKLTYDNIRSAVIIDDNGNKNYDQVFTVNK